jgi:hypothetical protein
MEAKKEGGFMPRDTNAKLRRNSLFLTERGGEIEREWSP